MSRFAKLIVGVVVAYAAGSLANEPTHIENSEQNVPDLTQDPLFNPSKQYLLGPELSSIEASSPVYDGLKHALIDDISRLTSFNQDSIHSFTDIDSLPYEQEGHPVASRRHDSSSHVPFKDPQVCGYEVTHYCPGLSEGQLWGDLALCLHDMYHRTQRSVVSYNKYLSNAHSAHFTPIEHLHQLPHLSPPCRSALASSLSIQCMPEVRALCGMPEAPQHIMMCFEEHSSRMTGPCAAIVDRYGGISDRGATGFTGHVVSDMNNVTPDDGRSLKEAKEAGWLWVLQRHPALGSLTLLLCALLVVLLVYLLFGDIATIKRKCCAKQRNSRGRMVIPEDDNDYKDVFGDSDYNL